jgi:hypothetical protein
MYREPFYEAYLPHLIVAGIALAACLVLAVIAMFVLTWLRILLDRTSPRVARDAEMPPAEVLAAMFLAAHAALASTTSSGAEPGGTATPGRGERQAPATD